MTPDPMTPENLPTVDVVPDAPAWATSPPLWRRLPGAHPFGAVLRYSARVLDSPNPHEPADRVTIEAARVALVVATPGQRPTVRAGDRVLFTWGAGTMLQTPDEARATARHLEAGEVLDLIGGGYDRRRRIARALLRAAAIVSGEAP